MANPYINMRKIFIRIIVLLLSLFSLSSYSQKIQIRKPFPLSGRYKKINGHEILILNSDNSFICLKNYLQKSDVITSECDTLASGIWDAHNNFITLKNDSTFNSLEYLVAESQIRSVDSIYFKIILTGEDILDYSIFRFSIVTSPMHSLIYEFDRPEFAISKSDLLTFNFFIKNVAPNSDFGKKSYQRIYFNVFENYRPKDNTANYFIITIKNFRQCFYEAIDVSNEIIGIEGKKLFWRGNIYRRI